MILTHAKYLHWRCKNYVELARSYADIKAFKAAIATIGQAIKQVELVKKIEEQDLPILDSARGILSISNYVESIAESFRILKQLEIKYQLQSGVLTPDAWKKKVEETFGKDKYHRAL